MYLLKIVLLLFNIVNVNSFVNMKPVKLINTRIKYDLKNFTEIENNILFTKFNQKAKSLIQLTRPKNIIPTIFLSFSGGWIMDPSIYLFTSIPFIISVVDAVIIMSTSMVINDIYDIKIDKINSPTRPLASGEIKAIEALFFSLFLLGTCEYLTFQFMPDNLKLIIQLIIIKIVLYTPILKKMLIIKNVSCATLVSFSLFFSGLATSNTILAGNKNFGLLLIAMSLIFVGSWTNEILLDIRDTEGDKYNNITTVSTVFGKETSLKASGTILNYGIVANTFAMAYLYDNLQISLFIPLILNPLVLNLQKIKKHNFSNVSIVNYMKNSYSPLFGILIYLCIIAYFFTPINN